MSQSKNSKARVRAAVNKLEALQLRRQGLTYAQIGQKLKVTTGRAHQLVTEEMDRLRRETQEEADRTRQLELMRLDHMQATFFPKAEKGDVKAALLVLKIMQRRAKLLGLDVEVQAVDMRVTQQSAPAADSRPALPEMSQEEFLARLAGEAIEVEVDKSRE